VLKGRKMKEERESKREMRNTSSDASEEAVTLP